MPLFLAQQVLAETDHFPARQISVVPMLGGESLKTQAVIDELADHRQTLESLIGASTRDSGTRADVSGLKSFVALLTVALVVTALATIGLGIWCALLTRSRRAT